eukprot:scaffold38109_cov21-Cyclotella_meneghiniana.AAC.1
MPLPATGLLLKWWWLPRWRAVDDDDGAVMMVDDVVGLAKKGWMVKEWAMGRSTQQHDVVSMRERRDAYVKAQDD